MLTVLLAACGGDDSNPDETKTPDGPSAEKLTALGLFEDAVEQTPSEGVIPYDVNAVLYADESEKLRFISIPDGESATYDAMGLWDYPDGTRFVKTFFYYLDARDPSLGRRLLETRIVERAKGAWTGRTYLWNDAQTVATRHKVGKTLEVEWIDADGNERRQDYRVPNDNECKTCHSKSHHFEPLGPRTRQLNRDHAYDGGERNQIDYLVELGWLQGQVGVASDRFTLAEPYGSDSIERRARAYLDANCSHCHRPGGEAGSTALDLRAETTNPYMLGVCRHPVSAGPGAGDRSYDIVPGDPDASILVFRMESTDPELKMPELPTLTSDSQGTELVRAWIAAMQKSSCN
jgi:uncharacterized repeat protein (TIGR03806 family)